MPQKKTSLQLNKKTWSWPVIQPTSWEFDKSGFWQPHRAQQNNAEQEKTFAQQGNYLVKWHTSTPSPLLDDYLNTNPWFLASVDCSGHLHWGLCQNLGSEWFVCNDKRPRQNTHAPLELFDQLRHELNGWNWVIILSVNTGLLCFFQSFPLLSAWCHSGPKPFMKNSTKMYPLQFNHSF